MAPNPVTESSVPKVSPKSSKSSGSSDSDIDEGLALASAKLKVDDGESLYSENSSCTESSSSSKHERVAKENVKTSTKHHHKSSPKHDDNGSQDNILFQKRNILHEFERLSTKGYKVPKYTMASSYEEMRFEYDNIKKNIEVDVSVKFQRSCILGLISAIEFLNNRYDPFEIKLDGWTEQISGRIETFDDIMEEIFHKYKNKMKMAPELSLAFALISSMFFVHLANTAFKPSSQPSAAKAQRHGANTNTNTNTNPNTTTTDVNTNAKTMGRPTMRGPSNVALADDTVSIMSDSTEVSHVSSLSSRITLNKNKARRTLHI